jgi:membrane-associated phospholipid phosphatase
MLVAGLLVQGLKRLIGAPRPLAYYAAQGALDAVRVVGEPLRAQSFPSGHAAAWGCAAAFLSLRYPKLWPVFAAAALLGGFSRVYVGAHFAIDVAAGWVLGAACGVAAHLVLTRSTRAKA